MVLVLMVIGLSRAGAQGVLDYCASVCATLSCENFVPQTCALVAGCHCPGCDCRRRLAKTRNHKNNSSCPCLGRSSCSDAAEDLGFECADFGDTDLWADQCPGCCDSSSSCLSSSSRLEEVVVVVSAVVDSDDCNETYVDSFETLLELARLPCARARTRENQEEGLKFFAFTQVSQATESFSRVEGATVESDGSSRIWVAGFGARLELWRTSFAGGFDSVVGGCLYLQRGATVVATDALFANCSSDLVGGGIGGWTASTIILRGASRVTGSYAYRGGGIYGHNASNITIRDATRVEKSHAAEFGGGIYAHSGSTVTIVEAAEIQLCSAGNSGGGLNVRFAEAVVIGGHIFDCTAEWGGCAEDYASSRVTLVTRTAVLERCTATYFGGGLSVVGSSLEMEGRIEDCHAGDGAGGLLGLRPTTLRIGENESDAKFSSIATIRGVIAKCSGPWGGGLLTFGIVVVAGNASIHECTARSGGAVLAWTGAKIVLKDSARLSRCRATLTAGCLQVYTSSDAVMRDDASIKGCSADTEGGGAYVATSGTLVLRDFARIEDCDSAESGGGVHSVGSGVLTVQDDAAISGCLVHDGDGGGVSAGARAEIRFLGRSKLSNNAALRGTGGGAFVLGRMALVGSVVVASNLARAGAGIAVDGSVGRLYASSSCRFLEVEVDRAGVSIEATDRQSVAVLRANAPSKSLVDARGSSTLLEARTDEISRADICLGPASDYVFDLYSATSVGWGEGTASLFLDVRDFITDRTVLLGEHAVRISLESLFESSSSSSSKEEDYLYSSTPPRIVSNEASEGSGGGILVGGGSRAMIHEAVIAANTASDMGGGIVVEELSECELSSIDLARNSATDGGGLSATLLANVRVSNSKIQHNTATGRGGGCFLEATKRASVEGTTFDSNAAVSGGGLLATNADDYDDDDSISRVVEIAFSEFLNNKILLLRGGGLLSESEDDDYLGAGACVVDSLLRVRASNFSGNRADLKGDGAGLAIVGSTSSLQFADTTCVRVQVILDFTRTTAVCSPINYDDAGLTCDGWGLECNYLQTVETHGYGLSDCSGCACDGFGTMPERYCRILRGEVEAGIATPQAGAMRVVEFCLEPGARYRAEAYDLLGDGWFGGEWWVRVYGDDGHTIVLDLPGPPVVGYESLDVLEFEIPYKKTAHRASTASDNAAPRGGGGFLYFTDAEPVGTVLDLGGNAASYGDWKATPARTLRLASNESAVVLAASGQIADAPIAIEIVDDLGQRATSLVGASAIFRASDSSSVANGVTEIQRGVASFDALVVTEAPGANVSAVVFSALRTLRVNEQKVTVLLRPCYENEYARDGACRVCDDGLFYSKTRDYCEKCPKGVECDEPGQALETLVVERGWFRATSDSTEVYRCRRRAACDGGPTVGSALCRSSYVGVLCASCRREHFFNMMHRCQPCGRKKNNYPLVISIILLACLPVVFLLRSTLGRGAVETIVRALDSRGSDVTVALATKKRRSSSSSTKTSSSSENNTTSSSSSVQQIVIKVKGVVSFLQIVANLPQTLFDLPMPVTYLVFLQFASATNVTFSDVVPLRCFLGAKSNGAYYAHTLAATVLAPLLVLGILVASYSVSRRRASSSAGILEAQLGFFFLHLALPSVSTTAVQALVCRDFDFGRKGSKRFLDAALSVSCESTFYQRFVFPVGLLAALIYPIGCPLGYFALLYSKRHVLNPKSSDDPVVARVAALHKSHSLADALRTTITNQRHVADVRRRRVREDKFIAAFASLYEFYEPRTYFWEPVDVVRRLLLTAGISTIPGTAEPLAFGLAVSLVFGYATAIYQPFMNGFDDFIATTAINSTSATFFVVLLLSVGVVGRKTAGILAILVAAIPVSAILYVIAMLCFPRARAPKRRVPTAPARAADGDEGPLPPNHNSRPRRHSVDPIYERNDPPGRRRRHSSWLALPRLHHRRQSAAVYALPSSGGMHRPPDPLPNTTALDWMRTPITRVSSSKKIRPEARMSTAW